MRRIETPAGGETRLTSWWLQATSAAMELKDLTRDERVALEAVLEVAIRDSTTTREPQVLEAG